MAAKKKTKEKRTVTKTSSPAKKPKTPAKPKAGARLKYAKPGIRTKEAKLKCCVHCQDYEFCQDKGACCEYCDYLIKGKCTYRKDKKLLSADKEKIEIGDYRGDDYGIDDYEAYEDLYE